MSDEKDLELDEFNSNQTQMDESPILSESDIEDTSRPQAASDLEAVYDIPVKVSAILGRSDIKVNKLLKLGRGAIIELDRRVGEAIDIYVNDKLVARGEVVVVNDKLGITMTEIVKNS